MSPIFKLCHYRKSFQKSSFFLKGGINAYFEQKTIMRAGISFELENRKEEKLQHSSSLMSSSNLMWKANCTIFQPKLTLGNLELPLPTSMHHTNILLNSTTLEILLLRIKQVFHLIEDFLACTCIFESELWDWQCI